MPVPMRSVLTAFKDVEDRLRAFLDHVPFVAEHDEVWSPILATCLVEACSQLDSFWKASSATLARKSADIKDHFVSFGESVAARWLVVWGDEGREVTPFFAWEATGPFTEEAYTPLAWWQAYNDVKHDRWANIQRATLLHTVSAVAGLFLAIARSSECVDSLVGEGWFRSRLHPPRVAEHLARGEEDPKSGATIESALFSYASGSAHAEFGQYLCFYGACTHRFGRWLEKKYDKRFFPPGGP